MKNSMKAFKRFTCLLGILFILLGLLPVPVLSNVGQVFADEVEVPGEPGGGGDPGAGGGDPGTEGGGEDTGGGGDPGAGGSGDAGGGKVKGGEMMLMSQELECPGCENLPQEEDPAVSGSFKVDAAIPGSGNAAMTGDLTVGGYTFENVPGVCGEVEDTIQIGSPTSFSVCSVTDTACINAMRTEQGKSAFTDDEAFFYGSSFDDIFEASVNSGDYNPAINAFRWITGNNTNPFDFLQGDERISTWIGLPQNQPAIQSLAWWLGDDCSYEHCTPTRACPADPGCGYAGETMDDGCGKTLTCPATDPCTCEPTRACPVDPGCGYAGETMDDGCGKQLTCLATDPCPVNCEWSEWSACSATCGGGTQTRTQLVRAAFGGVDCEGEAVQQCNMQACPTDDPGDPGDPGPAPVPVAFLAPPEIPVTAAGGPTEELLLIPVTGLDLSFKAAGLQTLSLYMGMLLFGVTMVLEGFDRKKLK